MPFDPIVLHNQLPTFKEAAGQPDPVLTPYLQLYQLDQLQNLTHHQLGLINGYGAQLCVQLFVPEVPARGTAILVHGYMEHMALNRPLIQQLLNDGFAVLGYDLPGHGQPRPCQQRGKGARHPAFQRQGPPLRRQEEIVQRQA